MLARLNIRQFNIFSFNKFTPLFTCILNNNSDIMNVLLTKYRDKININQHNIKKACPVHMLCKTYRELRESEKNLLRMDDLQVNEHEKDNLYTPLHLAVLYHKISIAKLLLDHPQIDVNIQDKDKNTPLHYASSFEISKYNHKDCYNILELLLSYTTKKVNIMIKNKYDLTPLQSFLFYNRFYWQQRTNYIYVIELFVKYHANSENKNEIKKLLNSDVIESSNFLKEKLKD